MEYDYDASRAQVWIALGFPVIAAGGIGRTWSSRAFCLALREFRLGTRMVCCSECQSSELQRGYLKARDEAM